MFETCEHFVDTFVDASMFGGVVGKWVWVVEENMGLCARYKPSTPTCLCILLVRRDTNYGNISIFWHVAHWGTMNLKSMKGLKKWKKIQGLSVSGCSQLKELPSMESLTFLVYLWEDECFKLTNLQNLNVCRCSKLEEIEGVETWMSLERLMSLDVHT